VLNRRLSLLAVLFSLFWVSVAQAQPKSGKVIVLGFDGVDARYTERWMNEGKLPNLARLRGQGTFRSLLPTIPAQTPVSWSTFSTGIDPGRTGIFDFLRRDPKTYLPLFAAFDETTEPFLLGKNNKYAAAGMAFVVVFALVWLAAHFIRPTRRFAAAVAACIAVIVAVGAGIWTSRYLPTTRPGVINRREGIPMWEAVARAGKRAQVVHVPVTFPARDFPRGHLLSGLGVPDISGRIGKPFYFTSELDFRPPGGGSGTNEFSIEIVQLEDNRGVIETEIVGPPNKLFKEPPYISTKMTLTVPEDRSVLQIEVDDQKLALKPGQWSDWVRFVFAFNPVIKIHGASRFYLLELTPEIKMYLSPINFDPRQLPPGLKISTPEAWAEQLAERHGPYKTMGWAIDTWAISEGFATEQMFWDDMVWTVDQYRTMYRDFLRTDDDLFLQCFEFPDRVGHIFWRVMDEKHPAYTPELAAKWGDALEKSYVMMDQIVGEAMEAAQTKGATLIVVSDHGFATWRKSVNYNTWLVQNGYLGMRSGVEARERTLEILFDSGQFWENVDWSRTRAYAMGLGQMYINLKGRESQGIVEPADYEALKKELAGRLEAMVDPENGAKPISRVVTREQAYRAFDPNLMPDLFILNNDGYRVSWQTSLGGIQKELFEPNRRVWSGDHCSLDPELVQGIFFINRKLTTDRRPYIADIYPTVLGLLNVQPPYQLDGVALR
jgi:predicted AlkP superfamily phosphohydrolase/phosphomutase